jgi:hypothetical protein
MAGFEVTLYGRIWVTPKDRLLHNCRGWSERVWADPTRISPWPAAQICMRTAKHTVDTRVVQI